MLNAYLNDKYYTSPKGFDSNLFIPLGNSDALNLKFDIRLLHGELCKKDEVLNVSGWLETIERNNAIIKPSEWVDRKGKAIGIWKWKIEIFIEDKELNGVFTSKMLNRMR